MMKMVDILKELGKGRFRSGSNEMLEKNAAFIHFRQIAESTDQVWFVGQKVFVKPGNLGEESPEMDVIAVDYSGGVMLYTCSWKEDNKTNTNKTNTTSYSGDDLCTEEEYYRTRAQLAKQELSFAEHKCHQVQKRMGTYKNGKNGGRKDAEVQGDTAVQEEESVK